jgi:hypothetical protein
MSLETFEALSLAAFLARLAFFRAFRNNETGGESKFQNNS